MISVDKKHSLIVSVNKVLPCKLSFDLQSFDCTDYCKN